MRCAYISQADGLWDFYRRGIDARYVFTYRGQPIYHVTTAAWYKAQARDGIDAGFTFHDLRHTWASWHVQAGTPLHVLQELGGWESAEMVRRYAHLSSEHFAGYVEKFSGMHLASGTDLATAENKKAPRFL